MKNDKIANLNIVEKEIQTLMQLAKDATQFLKLDNQRILWDNKLQQKLLYVFMINIYYHFLKIIINLYLITLIDLMKIK